MNRPLRNWILTTAIVALIAFLAACGSAPGGGGGDGGGDDGDGDGGGGGGTTGTRDVGFVAIDERAGAFAGSEVAVGGRAGGFPGSEVTAGGGFWRFDSDVPAAFFDDPWGDLVGTCEVFTLGDIADDPFQGLPLPDDLEIVYLSGGDPLTVRTGAATYLELDRLQESFGGQTIIAYTTGDAIAGPLPSDLTLSIPGDAYPAVASAAFPSAPAFALTAPADPGAPGSVDLDTTFEWSGATNDDGTVVTIDLLGADFQTFVTCYAADTGSFTLPAATRTELGAGFSGSVDTAGRESIIVHTVGDARLLLAVTRSESYDIFPFQ